MIDYSYPKPNWILTDYHRSDVVVKNIVLEKESTIDITKKINFQPDILTTSTTVPTLKTNTSRRPIHPGKFPAFMVFNESEGDKNTTFQSSQKFSNQYNYMTLLVVMA